MKKMVNRSGNVIFVANDRINEYVSAGFKPADFISEISPEKIKGKPEIKTKTIEKVNDELKATVKKVSKRTRK